MQRDSAMRWVIRQRNRMLLQADAVDLERRMRLAHDAKEEAAFNHIADRVKEHRWGGQGVLSCVCVCAV